ncbi:MULTISPECIES: sigma 54-interacting transcriptional regulator [unclassified Clostridioides]|uniref:sigma-54 interaction domain-containing protein n=1 Tax=unclassified Clostridioides TaxID=2635829 RepID=UPI001D1144A7|nr:sigma 54-interacting transcriptional regulator [Clostridioides sp. ES-S-0056-01]MCC0715504.1 sigma 54-interacting transcriptional regulator [Clostridioides sp. ES-S-0077-01]
MKKIILAGINDKLKKAYKLQLEDVLGEIAEIETYDIEDSNLSNCDVIVAMNYLDEQIVDKWVKKNTEKLVLVKTMYTKQSIEKLKQIPRGKRVLIITPEWIYALECITILKNLGINHIEFVPYHKELFGVYIENVDTAIYLGESFYTPDFITNFIDIGWREIVYNAYLEILKKLGISQNEVSAKLDVVKENVYSEDDIDIKAIMKDLMYKNRIHHLINSIPIGMIILNQDKTIELYNEYARRLLNIKESNVGKDLSEIKLLLNIYNLFKRTNLKKNIYYSDKTLNKEFIVSKNSIDFMGKNYQEAIFIDEVFDAHKGNTGKINKSYLAKYTFNDIVGNSQKNKEAIEYAKKYSKIDSTVLILGQTGTGKELYAHSIHNYSNKNNRPFISINCTAIPDELLESELFGYESGSFTGASSQGKKGLFEIANGGTIFLDEIGDTSQLFQVKLLRVLQEKEIVKIGGYEKIRLDIRVIAATNKTINELRNSKYFRKDLFYRLSTCILSIPSLEERKEDIPVLCNYFLENIGYKHKKMDSKLKKFLYEYKWDGNVRELKNCIEYVGNFGGELLTIDDLPMIYKDSYKNKYYEDKEPTLNIYENNLNLCKNNCEDNQNILNKINTIDDINFEKTNEDTNTVQRDSKIYFENLSQQDNIVAFEIMRILYKEKCGRRAIVKKLQSKNINSSEHNVRVIMNFLESEGYIDKSIGRNGSHLEEKGKKWVDKNL